MLSGHGTAGARPPAGLEVGLDQPGAPELQPPQVRAVADVQHGQLRQRQGQAADRGQPQAQHLQACGHQPAQWVDETQQQLLILKCRAYTGPGKEQQGGNILACLHGFGPKLDSGPVAAVPMCHTWQVLLTTSSCRVPQPNCTQAHPEQRSGMGSGGRCSPERGVARLAGAGSERASGRR